MWELENYLKNYEVDDREVKTEEALANSADKNKKKPKLDPGRVSAGKILAECNRKAREVKKRKSDEKVTERKFETLSLMTLSQVLSVHSVTQSGTYSSFIGWTVFQNRRDDSSY